MHLKCVLAASCGAVVFAGAALAQSTFGSITGVVSDASGAVVTNATVSVTNEGTGVVREAASSSTGAFNVPNLDIGIYRLRVGAQGFTTYERAGLNLAANQVLNVNVELAVGATASVVEVQAASPTITTETNDLSTNLERQSAEKLPLVSRHAGDAGITTYYLFNTGVAAVPSSSSTIIQGARSTGSVPTRDGITIMAYSQGTGPVQPSLESVEAITLVRAIAPAEFATAANLGVVTKGGTNEFHGGAFWDYNGNRLNARNFFASTVPFRVYHDFGATLTGPVIRKKVFFSVSYEGSRESAKTVLTEDVPLPAFKTGDFSALKTPLTNPFAGQPFPGNQIPAAMISPVSKQVQSFFFPDPNRGAPGAQSSNWQAQYPGTTGFTRYNHLDVRVDYNPTSHDLIFGRISWRRLPLDYTDVYPLHVTQLRFGKSMVASWNHTISPAMVNEFRFGGTFHRNFYQADVVGSDLLPKFGIQGINTAGVHNVPIFNITGVSAIDLDSAQDSFQDNPATDFEWIDNLSWTRGRHFMKFGFDAVRDRLNGNKISSNIYGSYSFSGVYTGAGYADFLLGVPQTTTLGLVNPSRDFRGTTWAFYAQDQFKVNARLTLNYGLRWELAGPYYSKHGAMYNFDARTGALVVPDKGLPNVNPLYPKNIPVVTASSAGFPGEAVIDFKKNNFEPRIGFAYKPFGGEKTVVRGGYGIYGNLIYGAIPVQQLSGGPFSGSVTYTNRFTNGTPLFSFPSPFLTSGTTSVQNVNGLNPHIGMPYTQQWNMTVEHEVAGMGLRLSYLGSRSIQLIYRRNLNEPPPGLTPFSTSSRPYGLYNQVIYGDSGGTEAYHALEAGAQKRFGHNLTFSTGWTWARDLTDTQDSGGGGNSFGGQLIENQFQRAVEKANNQLVVHHRLFGYALYALPVGAGQPLLGSARGPLQRIAGGWETAWTVTAQSGQYFTPSFSGFDPSNTNTLGGRPDRIGNGNLTSADRSIGHWFDAAAFAVPGCPGTTPVCTSPAAVGRFGNSGLNVLSGPPLFQMDFALMKSVYVREKVRTQFRLTMANGLNHPNFAVPRSNISSRGTVGTIASQVRVLNGSPSPREIDLGLRVEF